MLYDRQKIGIAIVHYYFVLLAWPLDKQVVFAIREKLGLTPKWMLPVRLCKWPELRWWINDMSSGGGSNDRSSGGGSSDRSSGGGSSGRSSIRWWIK